MSNVFVVYRVQGLCSLNSFTIYQTYVDKTLTKRTSKAIQKRISDLLPEKTGDDADDLDIIVY